VTLAFRAEGVASQVVWGFAAREWGSSSSSEDGVSRTVYAGTGPDGVVLSSKDFSSWDTFMEVDDCHARAVAVWANALFVGTQPKGRIYAHNFASGEEYLFVETEDSAVTAFAEYGGKLYAGTSPAGIVYSFDGIVWREEHRPYGGGVTSMAATGAGLFVFSAAAEGPVVFDGTAWMPYPKTEGSSDTVASHRESVGGIHGTTGQSEIVPKDVVSARIPGQDGEDVQEARPASPQFNVAAAAAFGTGVAFGGLDNGVVTMASDNGLSRLFDIGSPVSVVSVVGDGALMVASGGKLYLAKETT